MAGREILTIQLGHYANFVGTHWWNIQESNFSYDSENPSEINSDVLYREGELKRRVTYTPRVLIADLKGTLGHLSEEGNLSEIVEDDDDQIPEVLWEEGRLETTRSPAVEKSAFIKNLEQSSRGEAGIAYDLENETKSWVDYLVARFHSRTVNVIKEYEHGSTDQPFDIFTYGQSLWKSHDFSETFVDKIRAYAEECDAMQGFQILVDAEDGFSGLGSSCVQHLRDEYGKSVIVWPVIDGAPRDPAVSDGVKLINTVLLWQQLGEHSSLFSPLCCSGQAWPAPNTPCTFDGVTYKPELKFHTSALLATALDTLTLRYRNKRYPRSVLADLCADLNKGGKKVVATSLSLPFPISAGQDLIDMLDDLEDGYPWTSLTPSCNPGSDRLLQSLTLRGIAETRLKRPMGPNNEQVRKAAYKCSTVHEMMSLYLDCSCTSSGSHLTNIESPLKISDPYPKLFNNNVTYDGNLSDKCRTETDVSSVPVMAGLHTGKFIAAMYDSLHAQVKRRVKSLNRFHAFASSGLEQDEFEESVNDLMNCRDNYEERDI